MDRTRHTTDIVRIFDMEINNNADCGVYVCIECMQVH